MAQRQLNFIPSRHYGCKFFHCRMRCNRFLSKTRTATSLGNPNKVGDWVKEIASVSTSRLFTNRKRTLW